MSQLLGATLLNESNCGRLRFEINCAKLVPPRLRFAEPPPPKLGGEPFHFVFYLYNKLSLIKNVFMPKLLRLYIVLFFLGLVLSAIQPKEYFTWFLEVLPALLGFIVLAATYRRFAFSNFTYGFILLHCYILFIGG